MASVRSTIDLVITGATRGLAAASAEAEAMAARVEAAEDKVSAARTRSAAAEDRVGVAEQRLQAARSQQEAALSRIGVAETNLERVRDNSNGATTRLAQAQADLDTVRNRSGATADEVARAEQRVNQVRTESDRAAAELQRAEAQLETARANASRSSSSVAAAEAAIHRARSDAVRASEDLARSENDLNNVRRRGARDADNERSGILGLFDAFSRLGNAVTGADDAANRFLSVGSALQNVFSQIGGPIVSAVTGIAQFAAVAGAAVEIVGVLGGLIGQVLGGAPAILLALAAAAGTVVLGMDGIKKAAEAAAPAFDKLKAAVSDTFTKQLTPVFQQLAKDIPQLTENFQDIAAQIANMAAGLTGVISTVPGMRRLQLVLAGAADLIHGLEPGITALADGLIRAGAAAAPAMEALGAAIGSIGTRLDDVFSRLAADGTIQKAVQGLSATIDGLGAVIAPIIELLIRMGAALGDSVGVALHGVGDAITQVTPFFVKLADVAGKILVDAFNQLGPPLRELADSILPGAGQGLDGLASVMHNVVLPAIAGFINFLRTDAIPGVIAFTQGAIVQFTSFASGALSALSGILGALHGFFAAMALIPGPMQESFAKAAAVTDAFRGKVDGLKTSVDAIHDKTITMTAKTQGAEAVKGIQTVIDGLHDKIVGVTAQQHGAERIQEIQGLLNGLHDKVVTTTANVPQGATLGSLGNQLAKAAIDAVPIKNVTTTANVPGGPTLGTQGNNLLTGAIGAVPNKNVTTTGNVPSGPTTGTQGNNTLTAAIGRVLSKTVQVVANVLGLDQVTNLIGAIGRVVGKTVNIVANVIGAGAKLLGFASGGRVPTSGTFLVGENGPELLSLDALGAIVTPAARTRQILADRRTQQVQATPFATSAPAAAEQPITVNVMLSQDQIAGIAQVEIARRDRATKRTVLAGSGVTF